MRFVFMQKVVAPKSQQCSLIVRGGCARCRIHDALNTFFCDSIVWNPTFKDNQLIDNNFFAGTFFNFILDRFQDGCAGSLGRETRLSRGLGEQRSFSPNEFAQWSPSLGTGKKAIPRSRKLPQRQIHQPHLLISHVPCFGNSLSASRSMRYSSFCGLQYGWILRYRSWILSSGCALDRTKAALSQTKHYWSRIQCPFAQWCRNCPWMPLACQERPGQAHGRSGCWIRLPSHNSAIRSCSIRHCCCQSIAEGLQLCRALRNLFSVSSGAPARWFLVSGRKRQLCPSQWWRAAILDVWWRYSRLQLWQINFTHPRNRRSQLVFMYDFIHSLSPSDLLTSCLNS